LSPTAADASQCRSKLFTTWQTLVNRGEWDGEQTGEHW
jgi:hypothetical protein